MLSPQLISHIKTDRVAQWGDIRLPPMLLGSSPDVYDIYGLPLLLFKCIHTYKHTYMQLAKSAFQLQDNLAKKSEERGGNNSNVQKIITK